jgi:hypothetical protein
MKFHWTYNKSDLAKAEIETHKVHFDIDERAFVREFARY